MTRTASRIVVVEDNEINARLLVYQLKHLGYHSVEVFTQAHDALEQLRQNPCDVLLTDCQMRPMDGFELTRNLRQLEADKPQPTRIIAVTAAAMPESLQRCLEAGMDDYLIKPVQLGALQQMLNKWLTPNATVPEKHDAPPDLD